MSSACRELSWPLARQALRQQITHVEAGGEELSGVAAYIRDAGATRIWARVVRHQRASTILVRADEVIE